MQTLLLSSDEVARQAQQLYKEHIKAEVEREENIGKMVVIDVETGEFAVDANGVAAAQRLLQHRPHARLFGIRIGYDVAVSLGGVMRCLPSLPRTGALPSPQ